MSDSRPPQRPSALTGLLGNNKHHLHTTTPIPPSLQAKMAAFANRNAPSLHPQSSTPTVPHLPSDTPQPPAFPSANSFPPSRPTQAAAQHRIGVAGRRLKAQFKLSDIDSNAIPPGSGGASAAGLGAGRPNYSPNDHQPRRPPSNSVSSPFENFGKIVDPSGALNFTGKAVLHASGVDFSNGSSFAINMDQLQLKDELGRGNYGTVKKVLHKPTNVAMAMKEIRLELDDAKLNAIIMELDILHRAVAPEIVEFYGAFFIESCVYYCMEYMDAGSLDNLQAAGVPEPVLARVAASTVRGLKFLKDDLQIIHRDVKPTNVLVNRRGHVKLCDFGVSGQLERSLAKTNIGCQSYMAPERIRGESQNNLGTYTVSSDVWSLGLSVVEIGTGRYPYPPETYSNVFAQLTAIVHGDPPELPDDTYSETARDWVARCLVKHPEGRATYAELLDHPFLLADAQRDVDMAGWVARALAFRAAQQAGGSGGGAASPASSQHSLS